MEKNVNQYNTVNINPGCFSASGSVSIQDGLIMLFSALLCMLTLRVSVSTVFAWVTINVLVHAAEEDMKLRKISDVKVKALIAVWFIKILVLCGSPEETIQSGLKSLLSGLVIMLLVIISAYLAKKVSGRKVIGGGDIKLIFALSLFLGVEKSLYMILITCIIMITILTAEAIRGRGINKYFPMGPAIALSASIMLLYR